MGADTSPSVRAVLLSRPLYTAGPPGDNDRTFPLTPVYVHLIPSTGSSPASWLQRAQMRDAAQICLLQLVPYPVLSRRPRGPPTQYPVNPAQTHPRRSGDHLLPLEEVSHLDSRYSLQLTLVQSVREGFLLVAPGTAPIYSALVHLSFVDQFPLYLEYVAGQARRNRESLYARCEENEIFSACLPRPLLPARAVR